MTKAGWTREKPTVAGWYWWRDVDKRGKVRFCVCQEVYMLHGSLFATDCGYLDKLSGEWLGPLSPDSYQQGRVASCEWAYDDMDDYYETACKNAYCLADGTLKDNNHKYCPYCGGLIQLAQQAQGGSKQ